MKIGYIFRTLLFSALFALATSVHASGSSGSGNNVDMNFFDADSSGGGYANITSQGNDNAKAKGEVSLENMITSGEGGAEPSFSFNGEGIALRSATSNGDSGDTEGESDFGLYNKTTMKTPGKVNKAFFAAHGKSNGKTKAGCSGSGSCDAWGMNFSKITSDFSYGSDEDFSGNVSLHDGVSAGAFQESSGAANVTTGAKLNSELSFGAVTAEREFNGEFDWKHGDDR